MPNFGSTIRRATRFVTSLDSCTVLELMSTFLGSNLFPLPKPFSSVPQRVSMDSRAHKITVFWGGAVAAEIQVYLLQQKGESANAASVTATASNASPLLRACPSPSATLSQHRIALLLVEFTRGPASDIFSFRKLWSSTRKFLEMEAN